MAKISLKNAKKLATEPAHLAGGVLFGAAFGAALVTGAVPAITALSLAMKVLAGLLVTIAGMFAGWGVKTGFNALCSFFKKNDKPTGSVTTEKKSLDASQEPATTTLSHQN